MKLTLKEIVLLAQELHGAVDEKTGVKLTKGVLHQKLSIRAKYLLQNELALKIEADVKHYNEAVTEIFKELGSPKGEGYEISADKRDEFIKKVAELESIEKTIEIPKMNAGELFNIETEEYYPILLDKLLKKEEPSKATEAKVVEIEAEEAN